jgi:hypothetical protein
MGNMSFCHGDKVKSELADGAGTVPGHNDFPTSSTVQPPTCTGAQGLFAHAILQQLKNTHGISHFSSFEAHTQLNV